MSRSIRFAGMLMGSMGLLMGMPSLRTAVAADDFPVLDHVHWRLQHFVDTGEVPGAVTLVVDAHGIRHLGTIGVANIDQQRPMTPQTLFWIASMTKPITATAVMIQVERGAIDIDAPVATYLPEFAGTKMESGQPPRTVLTVKHLLTHTNGLRGPERPARGEPQTLSLEAQCQQMAAQTLKFEPGSQWEYGSGLSVCGRIIEVTSGQPYADFVQSEILNPLGMQSTTFYLTDKLLERHATPYQYNAQRTELVAGSGYFQGADVEHRQVPNPSGGLFSNAMDLARFYRMILNRGVLDGRRILSESSVQRMTTLQTGDIPTGFTPGNGWGLGWCIVRNPQGVSGVLSPGSFGHGGAYGTQVWVDAPRGLAEVLLIQRSDIGNSDGSDIRREFHRAVAEALGHPGR